MRAKKCKACKKTFIPERSFQSACSIPCAIHVANQKKEKEARKKNREQKEKTKTKPRLTKEAQPVFNTFIRFRDKDEPCISCGRYESEIEYAGVGGKWDCGHYLSVGSHPELRFDEDNAHKQCKPCNGGSGRFGRKNRTVSQEYRNRLIKKIGLERVERLEGPNPSPNWTHDQLREIKKKYAKKSRELMK